MPAPRVEEVSDSDPEISSIPDPDEVSLQDFAESDVLVRLPANPPQQQPPQRPPTTTQPPPHVDPSSFRGFQTIYPVYFDKTRSRAKGRRVSSSAAVSNPLARTIAQACSNLGLKTVLEADKTHPKDWANPGRVKVDLAGSTAHPRVRNKHHLYILIAAHLAANPTTESDAGLRLRAPPGFLEPGKPYPRPAVPRGWIMGDLLPLMSPAMTGGGVSDNLFGDMMREMQQQGGGAADADEEGSGRRSKDKKGRAGRA
ncbi:hypothetical protein CDD80_6707 [Ophiocordyceps camponoti-rufipedis]|uniref:Signal recognition particle SRP19 subunit n=1 Tax=Ophiocordyceps camponoti-rufipedis TaxID=2004952 RepID=A0A2C5YKB5_9HYPO|nr:hypothetical protein CDD80_6707 [Ophiocordyceps camponoti-rufipedis]